MAVERALSENVQIRQLAGSGAWIATSGSEAGTAHGLDVTGDFAHGDNGVGGLNGDPVCNTALLSTWRSGCRTRSRSGRLRLSPHALTARVGLGNGGR